MFLRYAIAARLYASITNDATRVFAEGLASGRIVAVVSPPLIDTAASDGGAHALISWRQIGKF